MSRHGYKDRRSSRYVSDSDSNSDCEAQPEHKVSRFIGDVAEKVTQPFEIATRMVVNPFGILFSPPKPKAKQGNKTRQGQHEDAYYGGNGKLRHSEQKTQYQDKTRAPQVLSHGTKKVG